MIDPIATMVSDSLHRWALAHPGELSNTERDDLGSLVAALVRTDPTSRQQALRDLDIDTDHALRSAIPNDKIVDEVVRSLYQWGVNNPGVIADTDPDAQGALVSALVLTTRASRYDALRDLVLDNRPAGIRRRWPTIYQRTSGLGPKRAEG